jgi:hypothetical protein
MVFYAGPSQDGPQEALFHWSETTAVGRRRMVPECDCEQQQHKPHDDHESSGRLEPSAARGVLSRVARSWAPHVPSGHGLASLFDASAQIPGHGGSIRKDYASIGRSVFAQIRRCTHVAGVIPSTSGTCDRSKVRVSLHLRSPVRGFADSNALLSQRIWLVGELMSETRRDRSATSHWRPVGGKPCESNLHKQSRASS